MAAGDLTNLDAVKVWLGLASSTSDTLLASLVTAASGFITNYLNRAILSATYTEVYDGNGADCLVLRHAPITAVASVQWSGRTITAAGSVNPYVAGVVIDGSQLRLIGDCFPYGRSNVQVTYTAGYATVPVEIAQACVELVGEAYKRRDRIGQNSKSVTHGEVISFAASDMNANIKSALSSYRRVVPS